jgi:UDP-N-acetylglucosamine acyltransferase
MPIHPSALIDSRAEIDPTADIGPYVVIDGPAVIGAGTRVLAHAVITGRTMIGRDNVIHMGAVIGHEPQDILYAGQDTALRIGDRNVLREHCEVHRGSKTVETSIGNDNYLMSQAHVGHDCRLGNHIIMATGATLAGHVEVGDQAYISGNCVVHQFIRIGRLALMRGLSRTSRDVPPFCIMDGTHTVRAINRVGLRRAGFSPEQIRATQRAFVVLFQSRRNMRLAIEELESQPCSDEVRHLLDFIRASKRGVAAGPRQRAEGEGGET